MTEQTLNNWKRLLRYLVTKPNVAVDQDTFGEIFKGRRLPVRELDCGTPGCLAYHAVVACASPELTMSYIDVRRIAYTLLSGRAVYVSFDLFLSEAAGWPEDLRQLYNSSNDNSVRRLAMILLVARVVERRSLTDLQPREAK